MMRELTVLAHVGYIWEKSMSGTSLSLTPIAGDATCRGQYCTTDRANTDKGRPTSW